MKRFDHCLIYGSLCELGLVFLTLSYGLRFKGHQDALKPLIWLIVAITTDHGAFRSTSCFWLVAVGCGWLWLIAGACGRMSGARLSVIGYRLSVIDGVTLWPNSM